MDLDEDELVSVCGLVHYPVQKQSLCFVFFLNKIKGGGHWRGGAAVLQRPVGNVGGHGVENLGWMGQTGLSVMLYCQSLFLPQVCRSFLESVGYIVLGYFFF